LAYQNHPLAVLDREETRYFREEAKHDDYVREFPLRDCKLSVLVRRLKYQDTEIYFILHLPDNYRVILKPHKLEAAFVWNKSVDIKQFAKR